MDWEGVGAQLARMGLPVLGRALGGSIPVIGPVIGSKIGENIGEVVADLIASKLGVDPTPSAVSNAIERGKTSEVMQELKAAQADAIAKYPALAQIADAETRGEVEVAKVNQEAYLNILKMEMAHNDPRLTFYRTLINWSVAVQMIIFGVTLNWAVFTGGDLLDNLVKCFELLTWWIGMNLSIVGVHYFTRGKERVAAVTTGQTGKKPVLN